MKKYFKVLLSILSLVAIFTLFGCKVNDNSNGDNLSKVDGNGTHNDIMVYDFDEFYHYHDDIKEEHIFGEWEIIIAPTTQLTGEKSRECSVCGYIETNELPKNITIVWVDIDGNTIDRTETDGDSTGEDYSGEIPTKPSDNTYYYTFAGWEISVQDDTVIVYIPRFKENKIVYTANFYDSGNTLLESINYYYGEDLKKPSDPIKEGYEFTGWKLESSGGAGGSDGYYSNFIATYKEKTVEYYTVKFIDYNDDIISEKVYESGQMPEEPAAPSRESDEDYSYEFIGWDKEITSVCEDTTYKACYKQIPLFYTIKFDMEGGIGGSESVKVYYGKDLPLASAPSKVGYTFDGYYDSLDNMYYDSSMVGVKKYDLNSDVTLTAKWSPKTYTVNIECGEYTYLYDTTYTVLYGKGYNFNQVETSNNYKFKGWQYEGNLITNSNGYISYWDIDSDVTLTPLVESLYTYTDSSKTSLYFGTYPQTLETSYKTIKELNSKAAILPTEDGSNWKDYGYYINGKKESYMYYIDIDLDQDDEYDYRGVYFTDYRSTNTLGLSTDSYQHDNEYLSNTIYWFKYEKIKWNILTTTNSKAMLICDLVVDSQNYYNNSDTRIDGKESTEKTIYANNYEYSYIRNWLNDTFYNTAFDSYEKQIIAYTNINNNQDSTASPTNQYVSDDTNDKIFILSYKEYMEYYRDFDSGVTNGSDYALCQGLQSAKGAMYWLRSPYYNDSVQTDIIDEAGYVDDENVCMTSIGVRACFWINL